MPEDKNQPEVQNGPPNEFVRPTNDTVPASEAPIQPHNPAPIQATDNVEPSPVVDPSFPVTPTTHNSELLSIEGEPTTASLSSAVSPNAPENNTANVFPQTMTESAEQSAKKRSRKLLIIGIALLLGIGLLTGTGAAAYSLWYQKPEKVLADAVVKLIQARAVVYEGDLLYQSKDDDMKLEVRFDGKADRANNGQTVDVKVTVDKKTFSLKASFLQTENSVFYFKLENLKSAIEYSEGEGVKLPAAAVKLIDAIDGRWVKITLADLREWGQEIADTQKCTGDVFKKAKNDDAAYREIADAYSLHPFVTSKGDIETKDGNLNFDVDTNEAELKKFVSELNKTSIFKKLQACDKDAYTLKPDDYETEKDAEGETSTLRVSISQWTHELREISSTYKSDGDSGDFILKPRFVEKVDMNEPKDAMTLDELQKLIEQLQQELMESFQEGMTAETTEQSV